MMMKKWKMPVFASLCAVLLLCGCSTGELVSTDKAFIDSLSDALEARWDLSEQQEAQSPDPEVGSEEHKEANTALVDAELDILSRYKDADFEDASLKKLANQYLDCLEIQKQALVYSTSEPEQFIKDWSFSLVNRCMLIRSFTEQYGLTVQPEYQDTLDGLLEIADSFSDAADGSGSAA